MRIDLKFINSSVTMLLALGVLSACGNRTKPHNRVPIEKIVNNPAPTEVPDGEPINSDDLWGRDKDPNTLCGYWAALYDPSGDFRILRDMRYDNKLGVVGRYNLGSLPQLRFGVSREQAGRTRLDGTFDEKAKKIDPPSVSEFAAKIEQLYNSTSAFKNPVLKAKLLIARNNTRAGVKQLNDLKMGKGTKTDKLEWTINLRNEKMIEGIEEQSPGIFGGDAKPLKKTKFYGDFLASTGLSDLTKDQLAKVKRPLELNTRIFISEDWNDRRADLVRSLRLLKDSAENKDLTLEEQACRYGIAQRLLAQIITIKGIKGAPRLREGNGFLVNYPKMEDALLLDETPFPEVDVAGSYNEIVNADWIKEKLALGNSFKERAKGTDTSGEFISSIQYWLALINSRGEDLWELPSGLSEKETRSMNMGKPVKFPIALLRLAYGLYGVNLSSFANSELIVDSANKRIHLAGEDTPDNMARLGVMALLSVHTLKGLRAPTEFDRAVLTEDQIESFAGQHSDSIVSKMQNLTYGIAIDGLYRYANGESSKNLNQVLRFIGRLINNERLKAIQD